MKIFRNILVLAASLFLVACGGEVRDVQVEEFISEDSQFVFAVDYLDTDQKELVGDILARFPETGLAEPFWQGFAEGFNEDGELDERQMGLLEEVVRSDWKLVFGMEVDEEIKTIDDLQVGEALGVVVAFKTTEADKLQELMEYSLEEDETLFGYEKDGAFEFWWPLEEKDTAYIGRYGDVFLLFFGHDTRKDIIKRIESGEGSGLLGNDDLKENIFDSGAGNLGYLYMNGEFVKDFAQGFYEEVGLSALEEYFAGVGSLYVTFSVDEDGFNVDSNQVLSASALAKVLPNPDYKLSLLDKVSSEGVIYYMEDGNFAPYLESFVYGFNVGFNGGVAQADLEEDAYLNFVEQLAALSGLELEEVGAIFSSPFAFVVNDFGGYYPGISFYLDLDEEQAEKAKKLNIAMDRYMQQVIGLYDGAIAALGEGEGALKTEVQAVGGGGFHKLYLDWDVFSEETVRGLAFVPGFYPRDVKVGIYYGLTGDGVYVLSLHPQFDQFYGNNVLGEDKLFLDAMESLGQEASLRLNYGRVQPMLKIMDRWFVLVRNLGIFQEADVRDYELIAKEWLPTIRYMIGGSTFEDGILKSKTKVRVKKL
jgi:hypothetical protein